MKLGKLSFVLKMLAACFVVVVACTFYVGDVAYASMNKKNESCYLNYVKAEFNGESHTFRGSLKPTGVPAELTWEEFFSSLKVTKYELTTMGQCDEDSHTMIMAYIWIDGEWKDLLYYDKETNAT